MAQLPFRRARKHNSTIFRDAKDGKVKVDGKMPWFALINKLITVLR